MKEVYRAQARVNERLENPEFRDDKVLGDEPVPTNTLGVYNRPAGISMVNSTALPTVILGLLIAAILVALVAWLS